MKISLRRLGAALAATATLSAGTATAFNPQPDPPAKLAAQLIDVPGAVDTFAHAINDAGDIAGYSDDGFTLAQGFVRHGTNITTLAVPGGIRTEAAVFGLNNLGQTTGAYYDGAGLFGFIHDAGGYRKLDPGGTDIFAFGINDAGHVAGSYSLAGVVHGWVYDGMGFTDIDHPGAARTVARGIDNAGRVFGYWDDPAGLTHAFFQDSTGFTDVDVPGALGTLFYGESANGDFVGSWYDATAAHGLLLHGDHFTTVDIPDADFTLVTGLGRDGTFVGVSGDPDQVHFHAFKATLVAVPAPVSAPLIGLGACALMLLRARQPRKPATKPMLGSLAALGLLAAAAVPALAAHSVQSVVTVHDQGAPDTQDTGVLSGLSATASRSFDVVTQFGFKRADISATAQYGHLFGTASAAKSNATFLYAADATTERVEFMDQITLTSATLAIGTPVDLMVTLLFSDDLSAGPGTCCSNTGVNGLFAFSGINASDQAGSVQQSINRTLIRTVAAQWFIGAINNVGGRLFMDAGSSGGVIPSDGSSRVDKLDALFYLTLPGDVKLVSDSGALYAAPTVPTTAVPAPMPATLIASAGLLLLGLHRRARRVPAPRVEEIKPLEIVARQVIPQRART